MVFSGMGAVEIMALILAVVAAVKILVLFIQPKSWASVVRAVYKNPAVTMVISLILAAIVLWYLLAVISIVQIFAVMLFIALLGAVCVSAYYKDVSGVIDKMLKDRKMLKKAWLAVLIWILLIIWVLYVLFV